MLVLEHPSRQPRQRQTPTHLEASFIRNIRDGPRQVLSLGTALFAHLEQPSQREHALETATVGVRSREREFDRPGGAPGAQYCTARGQPPAGRIRNSGP